MVINLNLSDGRRFDITNEDEEWSWSGQRRGSFSFTLSLRRSWCIFLDVVTSAWLHPACKPSCRACSREQTTQQQQAAGPCEQQTSACICALWSQHTQTAAEWCSGCCRLATLDICFSYALWVVRIPLSWVSREGGGVGGGVCVWAVVARV